jgi:hypothetical protein
MNFASIERCTLAMCFMKTLLIEVILLCNSRAIKELLHFRGRTTDFLIVIIITFLGNKSDK